MKTLLVSAALAAALTAPAAASAQGMPAAVIAVVDLEKVTASCNACKTANAALQGQVNALKSRQQALAGPLNTEGQSIDAAAKALNGKAPDAALQARAKAYQTKLQQAQDEIGRQEEQIRRNTAYIQKQIVDKLGPIYQQVMTRRGANIMLETGSTLATSNSVDVTNDVLAALNTALPTLATTAPAQSAPQGR
ncbi:MAG: OmpH family outer membrane protein [Myxococcales bacterium]|jgi:Skp family chaperone for outer membrane proteins|nr:OmpH family outer membrane protein [Sphingomicrobium sp.]